MADTFIMSQELWITSNEMGTIYNARVIIDDRYMHNFTAIIHGRGGTIYNGSVIIQRNGGLMSAVRQ